LGSRVRAAGARRAAVAPAARRALRRGAAVADRRPVRGARAGGARGAGRAAPPRPAAEDLRRAGARAAPRDGDPGRTRRPRGDGSVAGGAGALPRGSRSAVGGGFAGARAQALTSARRERALLHDARHPQAEARDLRPEDAALDVVHLVRAFHRPDRRRDDGAARVAVRVAGIEHRLLADDAGALDLLDLAVAVGDDPVPTAQLDARRALVRDRDEVGERVAVL